MTQTFSIESNMVIRENYVFLCDLETPRVAYYARLKPDAPEIPGIEEIRKPILPNPDGCSIGTTESGKIVAVRWDYVKHS